MPCGGDFFGFLIFAEFFFFFHRSVKAYVRERIVSCTTIKRKVISVTYSLDGDEQGW